MYPGVACNKIIPIHQSKIDCFKQIDDFALVSSQSIPLANIGEKKEDYIITIAVPGLHRDDFKIESNNSILTISAKQTSQNADYKIDRCEYNLAQWTRAFQLPDDADVIMAHAEHIHGEIIIHIPRSESNENKANAIIYVY